jgi:hypothetical protein
MKEKIQNKFLLFTQKISTKYLSQRVSPELFKETRVCYKIVGVSEYSGLGLSIYVEKQN